MTKLTLLALSAILAVTLAQTGRYRPQPSLSILNSGRSSGSSGRYNPDTAGRYSGASDGRYTPDNSGSYSHDGRYYHDDSGKYNPDGSGAYSGQNGGYTHDGSGVYTGVNDKYKHQEEKYKGEKYGSGGSGSGAGVGSGSASGKRPVASGSGAGSGTGTGAGSRHGSGSGAGIAAAGGFGAPVGLKQGSAAGKYDNRNYAIIRQEGGVEEDGYHYLYETENGIFGEEQGRLANRGSDEEAMRASGYFTYTGPDSVEYTVRYTADENGFIPEGAHLPTPPPIPEAIARALEWQRQNPTL